MIKLTIYFSMPTRSCGHVDCAIEIQADIELEDAYCFGNEFIRDNYPKARYGYAEVTGLDP